MKMLAAMIGTPSARTERELVAACLASEEGAWEELVERYKRLVFSIPLKRGLDRDEASDIFQAVFLDLLNELPRLRDPKALPAWLIKTTLHKVLKAQRRHDRFVSDDDGRLIDAAEASPADMPDAAIVQFQQDQALRSAVEALPPRCHQIVRMLFFETPVRPYAAVAAELGVATGSIGFLRSRCLDRLRRALHGSET